MIATKPTRRIKVLQIVGNAIIGGMETYVSRLIENLPRTQFEVSCLCPFESPFTANLRAHGCKVYITPVTDDPTLQSIQFTSALVRSQGIDVMHAHLSNAHLLASLTSALTGIKTLATVHGRTIPLMDFEVYCLGSSQLSVVCQNAYFHACTLGIAPGHLHLIPNGVDVNVFKRTDRASYLHNQLGLSSDIPLIGFIGRLAPEKGPALFMQMAALLNNARPDVHCVLVGDGQLRAELEQIALKFNINNIHFAGIQTDMVSVYSSLQMIVITSETEGMPLALLEAMASGLPTVATQVGGIAEVMQAGVTGLLVPSRSADALAAAVVALLNAPEKCIAMGNAASARIRDCFTLTHSVNEIARLLVVLARKHTQSQPNNSHSAAIRSNARTVVVAKLNV